MKHLSLLFFALILALHSQLSYAKTSFPLTIEEQTWIQNHPVIRVSVNSITNVFLFEAEDGSFQGISKDYLDIISEQLGVRFQYVVVPKWEASYQKIKDRSIDIIPNVHKMQRRVNYLSYTSPYYSTHYNIYSDHHITSMADLAGKNVAVLHNTLYSDRIVREYPEIAVTEVVSITNGIDLLTNHEVDGFLGTDAVLGWSIKKGLYKNTSDVLRYPASNEQVHMAVRNDWPILNDLINKIFQDIPFKTAEAVRLRWHHSPETSPSPNDLTAEEKLWLKQHPIIKVGSNPTLAPFEYIDDNGRRKGMMIDILSIMAKNLGITFDYVSGRNHVLYDKLKRREIDVISLTVASNARKGYMSTLSPIGYSRNKIYTLEQNTDIHSFADVFDKKVIVERDSSAIEYLEKHHPSTKIFKTGSSLESLQALLNGSGDVYIGPASVSAYYIQHYFFSEIKEVGVASEQTHAGAIGVSAQEPLLHSILQKQWNLIGKGKTTEFLNKYIGISNFASHHPLVLSPQEREWIRKNPLIRTNGSPFPPFIIQQPNGSFDGISINVLRYLCEMIGINLKVVDTKTWSNTLKALKEGKIDVVNSIATNPSRREWLTFTSRYASKRNSLYTKASAQYSDINDFEGRTLAIIKNTEIATVVQMRYPNLKLQFHSNIEEGLRAVLNDEADGFLSESMVIKSVMAQYGLSGLKKATELFLTHDGYRFATTQNNDILNKLLQRALNSIAPTELNRISHQFQKSVNNQYISSLPKDPPSLSVAGISLRDVILFALLATLALGFLTYLLTTKSATKHVLRYFDSPWVRASIITLLCIFVSLMVLGGSAILDKIYTKSIDHLNATIKTRLTTTNNELDKWAHETHLELAKLSENDVLRNITQNLLKSQENLSSKHSAKEHAVLFFQSYSTELYHRNFGIISPDGKVLASSEEKIENQESMLHRHYSSYFQKALTKPIFIPEMPVISKLYTPSNDYLLGTMVLAGPILDVNGKTIALFTLHIDPNTSFKKIFETTSLFEQNFDLFAFSSLGQLLSKSPFENELRKTGRLQPQQGSSLNLKLNTLSSLSNPLPSLIAPVDKALKQSAYDPLTSQNSYTILGQKGEVYEDYIGRTVYGTWLWNSKLDMGIGCQIPEADAFDTFHTIKYLVIITLTFTTTLFCGSILLIFRFSSRLHRAFAQTESELKQQVVERTLSLQRERDQVLYILNKSPIGVGIAINSTICYINPTMRKQLGVNVGDSSTPCFVDERDVDMIKQDIAAGNTVNLQEIQMVGRDGSPRDYLVTYLPTVFEGQEASMLYAIDVTEQNIIEEKLRHLIHLHSHLAKASSCLLSDGDLQDCVNNALSALRIGLQTNGAAVFENYTDEENNLCAKGIYKSFSDDSYGYELFEDFAALTYSEAFDPQLLSTLQKGEKYFLRSGNLHPKLQSILDMDNVDLVVLSPIFIREKWSGFTVFGHRRESCTWLEEDYQMLKTGVTMLGSYLANAQHRKTISQNQNYQQALLDLCPIGMAVTIDNIIVDANREFTEMHDTSKGQNILDVYKDPSEFHLIEGLLDTQDIVRNHDITAQKKSQDDKHLHIQSNMQQISYFGQQALLSWHNDISELTKIQHNLNNQRQLLQTMFDTSPVVVVISSKNKVLFVNPKATELLNICIGDNTASFYPDQKVHEALRARLIKREDIDDAEVQLQNLKTGIIKDYLLNINHITYLGEQAQLSWIVDITELKKTHHDLEKAKEKAENATKAKSDFLANMSHEIRTPMNAITGMINLALKTNLSSRQFSYMKKTQLAAHSLLTILNDILDFSKIEAGKLSLEKAPFTLEEVFQNLAFFLRPSIQDKQLELVYDLQKDLTAVYLGDKLRLGQVLLNLGNNAVKFTHSGEIIIKAKMVSENHKNAVIQFSIIDTGIGIPDDHKKTIFSSFSQADTSTTRQYGGTGLGLTISQSLTELMGGKIWFNSTVDKGSSFHFTVELEKQSTVILLPPPSPSLKDKSLLVIDDNTSAAKAISHMANGLGMTVSTSPTFDSIHNARQDFVIFDMELMEGHSLIAKNKHQRFIGATYSQEPPISLIKGFSGWLTKPVTPESLQNALEQSVEQSKNRNHIYKGDQAITSSKLKGARILLVEDDQFNKELAEDILHAENIHVRTAHNGLEALEILQNDHFDGILMDCQMPMMDGYQATREIRAQARFKDIPIIAMTAGVMEEDMNRAIEAGMNDHISKPIQIPQMFEIMEKWITPQKVEDIYNFPATIINSAVALKRFRGDTRIYSNLLGKFRTNQQDFIADFIVACREKEWKTAARMAHSLKGIAGTIGAEQLQKHCVTLEKECHKKSISNHCLSQVETELKAIFSLLEPFVAEKVVVPVESVDLNKVKNSLVKIIEQLQDGDPYALISFERNRQLFENSPAKKQLTSFEQKMTAYDFEGALLVSSTIMSLVEEGMDHN